LYKAAGLVPLNKISRIISKANFEILQNWLDICLQSHYVYSIKNSSNTASTTDDRKPGNTILPTRFLDLGYSETGEFCFCLIQTGGMTGIYIVLSHRWANPEFILKTLSSTTKVFQKSLSVDLLPRIYLQAIEIIRQLKIQYLWIDSLYIVQDNPEDWKRESQKIDNIFENCICIIAATESVDSQRQNHGIFLPRNDPLAVQIYLPFDRIPLQSLSIRIFKKKRSILVWKYTWSVTNNLRKKYMPTLESIDAAIYLRPRIESLFCRINRTE